MFCGNRTNEPFAIASELGQAINIRRAEHNATNQNDPYGVHRMFVDKARMLNAELIVVDIVITYFKGCANPSKVFTYPPSHFLVRLLIGPPEARSVDH